MTTASQGAHWQNYRWQVRMTGDTDEPLTGWQRAETLADCRLEFSETDALGAQIKRDGKPYGVLIRVGVRPRLVRVEAF